MARKPTALSKESSKKAEGITETSVGDIKFRAEQAYATAPVIYIDGVGNFSTDGMVAKFNLHQDLVDLMIDGQRMNDETTRITAARVVMPLTLIPALHNWLTGVMKGLKEKGLIQEVTDQGKDASG